MKEINVDHVEELLKALRGSEHQLKKLHELEWSKRLAVRERILQQAKHMNAEELAQHAKKFYLQREGKAGNYCAAIMLQKTVPIFTCPHTEKIFAYDRDKGYYVRTGAHLLKAILVKRFGSHATAHVKSEVIELLRSLTYTTEEDREMTTPLHLICVKNGIVDIKTGDLLPHSPEKMFIHQIPVKYNPSANCPRFQQFIKESVAPEDQPLVYDGYALGMYRKHFLEKFFVHVGSGSNGKSQLINHISLFFGEENISGVTLKGLCGDKFLVAQLHRRLVNVAGDIGGGVIRDIGILLQATGGDLLNGQHKNGQPFDFHSYATVFFSSNTPPSFAVDTDGIHRRVESIRWPHQWGNEADCRDNPEMKRADPNIIDKIATEEELSGLLNLALRHLRQILKDKQLSVARSTQQLRKRYQRMSNSAQAFLNEQCLPADYVPPVKDGSRIINCAEGFIAKDELYAAYVLFCGTHGLNCLPREWFFKQVKKAPEWNLETSLRDYVRITGTDHLVRSVRGLMLRSDVND